MKSYQTISCSVTGHRKKSEGHPCEDATRVLHIKEGTLVAVADGHGDKRCIFAFVGAELATKAATDTLKRYAKRVMGNAADYWNGLRDEIAAEIGKEFAYLAVCDYGERCRESMSPEELYELKEHIRAKGQEETFTPAELRAIYLKRKALDDKLLRILHLYGTTVRATLLTDRYLFNCALGDGDTIAVIDGRVEWLLPEEAAFGCETASLCEPLLNIIESFAFSFVELEEKKKSPSLADTAVTVEMLMLATDGFRNSYFSERLFCDKVSAICKALHERPKKGVSRELQRLFPSLSKNSVFQDDISAVFAVKGNK